MRTPYLLAASAMVVAALIAPASAMAVADPLPVEFVTDGEVQLHTATDTDEKFAPGTVYWEVQFKWHGSTHPYVASWERSAGSWDSVDQVQTHFADAGITDVVTERRQCQLSRIRDIAAATSSYDEFLALSGVEQEGWTLAPETWQEIGEACNIEPHDEWEWSWERTASTFEEGTTTVRIPIDVIGPGEHELFIAPYGFGFDPSSEEDELCRVHTWPDGGWASRACRFEWLATATTTVTVPEPESPEPADAPAEAVDASGSDNAIPILIASGAGLAIAAGIATSIGVARRRRSQP